MQYYVYQHEHGLLTINYKRRDESKGVIGSVRDLPEPLATADSLEAATTKAYAHLGHHPDTMLYVADSNGLLYEIAVNLRFHEVRIHYQRSVFIARTCAVLCTLCFVFTVVATGIGYFGFVLLALSLTIYLALVRWGGTDEREAAGGAVVFTIGIAFLILAIDKAWSII